MEAVYGLVIIFSIIALWRLGIIPWWYRLLLQLARRLLLRLARLILGLVEGFLAVQAPYIPILISIVRRTYRPAYRLLRGLYYCLCRLLSFLFRRSTSRGSNTDPNESGNGSRFVPSPRPPLTPSSSRIEPTATPSSPERLLCAVCQDAEKSVMLEPCRHICVCADCAESLLKQGRTKRNCPLCREYIRGTLRVFF